MNTAPVKRIRFTPATALCRREIISFQARFNNPPLLNSSIVLPRHFARHCFRILIALRRPNVQHGIVFVSLHLDFDCIREHTVAYRPNVEHTITWTLIETAGVNGHSKYIETSGVNGHSKYGRYRRAVCCVRKRVDNPTPQGNTMS